MRAGWCLAPPTDAGAAAPVGGHPASGTLLAELSLLGLGVVGSAALARRVHLLRRAAASLRSPGERLPAPSSEAGGISSLLAPLAVGSLLDWIECANRLLGATAVGRPAAADALLVRAGPDAVEFLFATEAPAPPPPFRAHSGGRFWTLPLEGDLDALAAQGAGARRYLPALLPVGEHEGSVYLLALGAGRRLLIEGASDDVARTLTGFVDCLRVLPWAEDLDVELLGLPAPPSAEQSYQLFSSTPAALRELAARAAEGATWRQRPLVVAAPGAGGASEGLLEEVGRISGIVACSGRATATLRVEGRRGQLLPFGLELTVSAPEGEQQRRFELLLAEASRSPALVDPSDLGLAAPPVATGAPQHELPPAGEIEVRLLDGAPRCVGAAFGPAERDAARVTELVSYLALHPEGVSRRALVGALFGRATLHGAPVRLDLLIAATRRALGSEESGHGRLELTTGEHLRLAGSVTSDWMRFRGALARAHALDPAGAVSLLTEALALLDGGGLARWPPYDWLLAEGLLEELRGEAVDASHQLAVLSLAGGDRGRAARAIEVGRSLEPASEMLARDLMVLAADSDDAEAARRVYTELEAALALLGGNEPSAETRALYLRLVSGAGRP